MLPALLEESGPTLRSKAGRRNLAAGLLVAVATVVLGACGGERQDEDEPEGEFPVEIVGAEFAPKQRLAQTSELTLTVANVGDETIPDLAITVFTDPNAEVVADPSAADPTDSEDSKGDTATSASDEETSDENLGSAVDQALQEELEEDGGGGTTEDEEAVTSEEEVLEEEGTTTEDALPKADGAFAVLSEQEGLAIPSRPVWILEQGYPRVAGTEPGAPPPGEISGAGGADAAQTNTFSFGSLEPNETREVVWQVTPVQAGSYTVHYRIAAGLQGRAVAVNEDGSVPEGEFVVRISDVPPQTRVDDDGKVVPIKKGDIIGQAGSAQQKSELPGQ